MDENFRSAHILLHSREVLFDRIAADLRKGFGEILEQGSVANVAQNDAVEITFI